MVHIFRPKNIGNLGIPLNKMASCRRSAKSSASLSFAELNLNCTDPGFILKCFIRIYRIQTAAAKKYASHFCLNLFHFKYFIGNKAQSQHSSSRNLYQKSLILACSAAPTGLETSTVYPVVLSSL